MLFENISYLNESFEVIKNTNILVEHDLISYIGKETPRSYNGRRLDGKNKLLMPGFVNTHCHVPMTIFRSLGGNLPLDKWLENFIFPFEAKLTEKAVYTGSLIGISEMIKSGVTSFNNMYYFSETICSAIDESGIKANIAMEGLSFDDSINNKYTCNKDDAINFFKNYNNSCGGRIKTDLSIHSEYTGNPQKAEMIGALARELNTGIQLHLSETEKETKDCILRHGKTPPQYFESLSVFDNHVIAAHCVYINDDDIEILKNKNVTVSHCPLSNLKLGSGICDISKLINKGINVTIGTDGAASNDNLNFLEDIKISALLAKGIHKDASMISSEDIIKAATVNGALSQRRYDTGVIASGKKADLFVMDFSGINLLPGNDFLNGLIYASLPENIILTMADGKILYENGVFTGIDIEKLKYEAIGILGEIK